ncbi:all-trans-13,14-dihydroretinol saturase [Emiliania huxleyi virus PS401]|nr:all-trans-13,14-dihydroretinol saturase [Emiliania huxleyi virus PS401]
MLETLRHPCVWTVLAVAVGAMAYAQIDVLNLWWMMSAFAVFMPASVVLLVLAFACTVFYEAFTFSTFVPAKKQSRLTGNRKMTFDVSCRLPEYDSIIIGSGPAGLSCASVLSQFGEKVLVLEQHVVTGGGSHQFITGSREAQFDAGLHFTVPQHEVLHQLVVGAAKPPVRTPPLADSDGTYERIAFADACEEPFCVRGGPKEIATDLTQRFPEFARQIAEYFKICHIVQLRFALWLVSALFPMTLRIILLRSPLFYAWRTFAGTTTTVALHSFFPGTSAAANKLRSIVSGLWIDTGSPPSRASFFMQLAIFGGFQQLGAAYPAGGSQRLPLSMVEAIESRDGDVFVQCMVERIILDWQGAARGVVMSGGRVVRAKRIISGLGWRKTMKLLPNGFAPARSPLTQQSCGFAMANVTLRGSAEELGIGQANTWVSPASTANNFDALGSLDGLEGGIDLFMKDPSYDCAFGITFPSCKDTLHDNPNINTCQILAPCEWDHVSKFRPDEPLPPARHAPPHLTRNQSYNRLKERWCKRMLAALKAHYPKITDNEIVTVNISTPLSIETYIRSEKGSAIGLDVTPKRFVDEEEIRTLDMKVDSVHNMWLCGQDVLMCGQVLASLAGVLCALRVLGPLAWVRFCARAVALRLLL